MATKYLNVNRITLTDNNDMPIIDIRDFSGVFTNGDVEDIPDNMLTELKNLRPYHGRLVKTHGFGAKIAGVTAQILDNMVTYINDNIANDGNTDSIYLGVYVNDSTYVVTLYGYKETGSAWDTLNNLTDFTIDGTYYHANAKNPVFSYNQAIRFLPGNVSKADGTNESKGIWIGYINRTLFDGIYTPTAKFYDFDATPERPDFDIYFANEFAYTGSGSTVGTDYYYRFSYVYDGNQESLLSDIVYYWDVSAINKANYISIILKSATITPNFRITGLKVYRSTSLDGTYELLTYVDLLRPAASVPQGATGEATGAHFADDRVCIPELTSYDFDDALTYQLIIDDSAKSDITTPADGTGSTVFVFTSLTCAADEWDMNWSLYHSTDSFASAVASSADGGAYWGSLAIIIPTAYTLYSLAGGVIDTYGQRMVIDNNINKALHVTDMNSEPTGSAYYIAKPSEGLYLSTGTTTIYTEIFDTLETTPSGEPPLTGEVSIKINGKFAEMISGRLWQVNVVLDPGGKGEVHEDWATYSELYQPDVNPVSNARYIPDREGGEITGLAQVFGNPVILKKQAIVRLDVTIAPGTPATWKTIESPHNIGNIAPHGYITVLGDLYITYYDGIYKIKPSNYSGTDSTPTENLRISEPITDTFESMTDAEKALIRCQYDQNLSEIIFIFPLAAGDETWALNIDTEQWREIETAITLNEDSILVLDEVADLMAYDATDKKVYTLSAEEDVDIQFDTKTFPIAFKRSELVKYLTIRYKSDETIALNVYSDIVFSEGDLVDAKTYRIHANSGGLDMTNIGAANNNVGTEFTCSGGTTPTSWGTGSVIQTSTIATKTLPVHDEAHNETIYIGRWVKEFKLRFSTS